MYIQRSKIVKTMCNISIWKNIVFKIILTIISFSVNITIT